MTDERAKATCLRCKEMIDADAMVCPFCRTFFPFSSLEKVFVTATIVGLSAMLLIGLVFGVFLLIALSQ
jgi:hypothetical protein